MFDFLHKKSIDSFINLVNDAIHYSFISVFASETWSVETSMQCFWISPSPKNIKNLANYKFDFFYQGFNQKLWKCGGKIDQKKLNKFLAYWWSVEIDLPRKSRSLLSETTVLILSIMVKQEAFTSRGRLREFIFFYIRLKVLIVRKSHKALNNWWSSFFELLILGN